MYYNPVISKLRSTVIVGLGGTGHDIVLRTKKRFADAFGGSVPPCVAFLAIDVTEPENDTIGIGEDNSVTLDPFTERLVLQVPNPANFIGEHNPHISCWWPEGTFVSAITAGATQIRPRGRLALFTKYSEVRRRLREAIDRVSSVRAIAELEERELQRSARIGVDVFIISSVAGGTGSGMMLDIAFNARDLIDSASSVTGVLVLPRIFDRDPGIRQKSNSYAALSEIEFFMKIRQGEEYSIDYGGEKPVTVNRPPFDLLFLIDAMNERRGVILEKDDLFDVVSEGIFMQAGTPIGARTNNSLDNIKGKLSASDLVCARSASYCSFGVASLLVDREQIAALMRNTTTAKMRALVNELLGTSMPSGDRMEAPAIYNQLLGEGSADALFSLLTRTDQSGERASMTATGITEDRTQIEAELSARYEVAKKREKDRTDRTVDANAKVLESEFSTALDSWLSTKMDSACGFRLIRNLVSEVISRMSQLEVYVQQARVADEEKSRDAVDRVNKARSDIQSLAGFWAHIRRGKGTLSRLKTDFVLAANAELQATSRIAVARRSEGLLGKVKGNLEGALGRLNRVTATLEEIVPKLVSEPLPENSEKRSSKPFESMIESSMGALDIVDDKGGARDFLKMYRLKFGELVKLGDRSTLEILEILKQFVSAGSDQFGEHTIDSFFERLDTEERNRTLRRLSDMASPLWCFDESKLPLPHDTLMENWCYGVFDANSTVLKRMNGMLAPGKTAPSFVSLNDPAKLTLFRISSGVPLFSLEAIDEMEYAYKRQQEKRSSHLDKRWKGFSGIVPLRYRTDMEPRDRTQVMFFVAQAPAPFGIVTQDESGYRVAIGGEIQALGDRREKAEEEFCSRSDYIKIVRSDLLGIIDTHGSIEIGHALQQRINKLRVALSNNGRSFDEAGRIEAEITTLEELRSNLDVLKRILITDSWE